MYTILIADHSGMPM